LKLIKNEKIKLSKVIKESQFKALDFKQNFTSRYSQYIYKKESAVKDITDGKIKDDLINRFRPFVAVNTEDKTNIDLAKWKKNNDISNSINLTATIDNWDYGINTLVEIKSEIVNNTFLIKNITYDRNNDGLTSTLELVDKGLFDV
jgi:prophage tail gpP-like protein